MSLFTNPITLNNGADHIFNFQAQLNDKNSVVGAWVEPAAALEDESKIVVKHDSNSPTLRRRLIQRKVNASTTTRGLRPITVNLTVAYDVEHASADIKAEIAMMEAILSVVTLPDNLLTGMI